jgi:hypothetical protein
MENKNTPSTLRCAITGYIGEGECDGDYHHSELRLLEYLKYVSQNFVDIEIEEKSNNCYVLQANLPDVPEPSDKCKKRKRSNSVYIPHYIQYYILKYILNNPILYNHYVVHDNKNISGTVKESAQHLLSEIMSNFPTCICITIDSLQRNIKTKLSHIMMHIRIYINKNKETPAKCDNLEILKNSANVLYDCKYYNKCIKSYKTDYPSGKLEIQQIENKQYIQLIDDFKIYIDNNKEFQSGGSVYIYDNFFNYTYNKIKYLDLLSIVLI